MPPPSLAAFLAAGPPPVYVGFGSIPSVDPEQTTDVAIEALARTGQRGVLVTSWGELSARLPSADIMTINGAPHDWLFPRVSAVVHHRGSGTVAAGLRAGKPAIICPILGDQPFWGRRLHALGVAPEPIPIRQLTVSLLAEALETVVTTPRYAERAASIAAGLKAERAVETAVRVIESVVADRGRSRSVDLP